MQQRRYFVNTTVTHLIYLTITLSLFAENTSTDFHNLDVTIAELSKHEPARASILHQC